jgi:hypothetical protein
VRYQSTQGAACGIVAASVACWLPSAWASTGLAIMFVLGLYVLVRILPQEGDKVSSYAISAVLIGAGLILLDLILFAFGLRLTRLTLVISVDTIVVTAVLAAWFRKTAVNKAAGS